jgi:hypothetical protein
MTPDPKATWIIPAVAVQFPDGSTLIKPGKAIQRAGVARTVKLTGIERRVLHALADVGLITRERPSEHQAFFYPGEIEHFLVKTRDPAFWETVRKRALLSGQGLKTAKPK